MLKKLIYRIRYWLATWLVPSNHLVIADSNTLSEVVVALVNLEYYSQVSGHLTNQYKARETVENAAYAASWGIYMACAIVDPGSRVTDEEKLSYGAAIDKCTRSICSRPWPPCLPIRTRKNREEALRYYADGLGKSKFAAINIQ
jgi:hypothetical protein